MSSSSSERPERYHYLVLKYLNGLPVVCTSTDRFDEAIRCLNFHNAVRVVRFGTDGGITDNLCFTGMVTQIEKDQISEIAPDVHPSRQKNCLPGMLFAKLTAIMRPLPITKKV